MWKVISLRLLQVAMLIVSASIFGAGAHYLVSRDLEMFDGVAVILVVVALVTVTLINSLHLGELAQNERKKLNE